MINRWVDRFGRTGFAAITSLIWALPMAAWAGSADLSPIDQTAYPWIALAIGLVMLAVWIFLLSRIGRIPVAPRQRRLDLAQMSTSEKRWTLALIAFGAGLIALLNGAATVDWGPFAGAIRDGRAGPILLALGLVIYLAVMLAGIWISWRRSRTAFVARTSRHP
jgi:hypothetical protein